MTPRYRDLPLSPGLPPGSSWGVFGADDQVGALNLLTPDRVLAGSGLVVHGKVFPLNWNLERPDPPVLGRRAFRHAYIRLDGGLDETYDGFNPQASSQWDALCHVEHPVHGFYNGHTIEEMTGREGSPLGIDAWARRGIAGPYTLIDAAGYRRSVGRPIDYDTKDRITADDLDGALAWQGTVVEPGSVLLIDFGWIDWYESLSDARRAEIAELEMFPSPGLHSEEATAEWLWDHGVAAVVADNPSVEAMPFDKAVDEEFLHFRTTALLGIAFGEMHDLRGVTADSAEDGVYRGFFVAAPVNKAGGAGSPGNALAIK